MKKKLILNIFIVFALIFCAYTTYAQAPQAIPYQAIARDNAGATLINQPISLRFSVHDGSSSGTIVYQETQNVATNNLGLFSINLGQGTAVSGAMTSIDWKNGAKFLQVELDPTGSTTYTDMGTSQLMSVPFALHAGSSDDTEWTQNGNDISNTNIGKVGIGTNAPSAKLEVKWTNAGGAEPITRIYQHNCGNACAQPSGSALQLINDNPSDPENGGRLTFAETINVSNNDEGAASIHLTERSSLTGNGGLAFSTRNATNVFGERMRISKEGNIGVGINLPGAKVHINDVNGIQNAPSADLVLSRVWNNTTDTRASSIFHYYDQATFNDNLAFGVSGDGGSFDAPNSLGQIKMMIQGNGNVGIGTINPTSKLSVAGNANVIGQIKSNSGGYGIVQTDGTVELGTYIDGSSGWFGTNTNHPLNFYTANGWESMTITTNGMVGIGTIAPSNTLSVNGNSNISGNLGIGTNTPQHKLNVVDAGNNTALNVDLSAGDALLQIKSPGTSYWTRIGTGGSPLAIVTQGNDKYSGSPTMYLGSDGNVAIGVSPSSNYKLAVGGRIICTELRVQATPFPDYVFDEAYNLKPLEEVEAHINTYHRLPNMPPATEVEANGMNVGGIQLKLVEKVEELTLYLLQQQKELKAQQVEITRLNNTLNNLKN